jgi:hypothetical protein
MFMMMHRAGGPAAFSPAEFSLGILDPLSLLGQRAGGKPVAATDRSGTQVRAA